MSAACPHCGKPVQLVAVHEHNGTAEDSPRGYNVDHVLLEMINEDLAANGVLPLEATSEQIRTAQARVRLKLKLSRVEK